MTLFAAFFLIKLTLVLGPVPTFIDENGISGIIQTENGCYRFFYSFKEGLLRSRSRIEDRYCLITELEVPTITDSINYSLCNQKRDCRYLSLNYSGLTLRLTLNKEGTPELHFIFNNKSIELPAELKRYGSSSLDGILFAVFDKKSSSIHLLGYRRLKGLIKTSLLYLNLKARLKYLSFYAYRLYNKKDYKSSAGLWKIAWDLGKDPDYLYNYACSITLLGRIHEASKIIQKLIKDDPDRYLELYKKDPDLSILREKHLVIEPN